MKHRKMKIIKKKKQNKKIRGNEISADQFQVVVVNLTSQKRREGKMLQKNCMACCRVEGGGER